MTEPDRVVALSALDAGEVLSSSGPWCYLVACSDEGIDGSRALRDAASRPGVVLRVLRGERCPTREELFHEWAAALQFPRYFGRNWDAFYDCLTDLAWLPAQTYLLVVTNITSLLPDDGRNRRIF